MTNHILFLWHCIQLFFGKKKSDYPWNVEHRGDALFLAGRRVGNAKIVKRLGIGANGVVFQIFNDSLHRNEALKLWLRLRRGDERDKAIQAIEEARKQAAAAGQDVVPIYMVERLRGTVLARMDFISGMNLKEHLIEHPNSRLEMLVRYVELMQRTTKPGVYHGDPHHGNVLVHWVAADKYDQHWQLKLCDFGTSHFAEDPQAGRQRHWSKIHETTQQLLKPLPDYELCWQAFKRNAASIENKVHQFASSDLPEEEKEAMEIMLRFAPYRDLINDLTELAAWRNLRANRGNKLDDHDNGGS